jgi:YXWGXW repeat-containing protein
MSTFPSIRRLLFVLVIVVVSAASFAQIGVSVSFAPPELPVYEQPLCPGEGYLWTPGYWAYGEDDYYWVPGTWVMAPEPDLLWTPAYWGWGGSGFIFYDGYWGPHVGFYGGISYGYGYFGEGYEGGRWQGGQFYYNRSVNNVNITNIHNVYNTTVINNTTVNRVSYNGGNGGINARPRPQEEAAARERHIPPVAVQAQHVQAARANPQLRASVNQGKPPIAATPRAGALSDRAVVPAKEAGGPYHPPASRTASASQPRANTPPPRPENNVSTSTASHAKDIQPHARPAPPNTGTPKVDQKYQQQQEKLYARQEQDHQRLQQKQEQDHQRLAQQQASPARNQQIEQKHQQQTQQMEQRHTQQQQNLQNRQQPASRNQSKPKK